MPLFSTLSKKEKIDIATKTWDYVITANTKESIIASWFVLHHQHKIKHEPKPIWYPFCPMIHEKLMEKVKDKNILMIDVFFPELIHKQIKRICHTILVINGYSSSKQNDCVKKFFGENIIHEYGSRVSGLEITKNIFKVCEDEE
ncbi:unnamed protein product [marine sediment metagenome]|uniref:Uncharacterized protein n=1 Tax=marine sediment metagenome TaxID=412755 RepID=X1BYY2_9ZZZZ